MSNPQEQPQPLVSPEAYINTQFGEVCQEISAPPRDVLLMLLFSFLAITPEERGGYFRKLKKEFNVFADAVNWKALEATIDEKVNAAELGLYDALAKHWESDSE